MLKYFIGAGLQYPDVSVLVEVFFMQTETSKAISSLLDIVCFSGVREGKWPESRFVRLNAVLGISGEAGEVSSARRSLRDALLELNIENIAKAKGHLASECGDVLWYVAYLLLAERGPAGRYDAESRIQTLLGREPPTVNDIYSGDNISRLFEGSAAAADEIKKNECHGRPLRTDVMDEALDFVIQGLLGILAESEISMSDACSAVATKLLRRYPNGFTTVDSIARKDESPVG